MPPSQMAAPSMLSLTTFSANRPVDLRLGFQRPVGLPQLSLVMARTSTFAPTATTRTVALSALPPHGGTPPLLKSVLGEYASRPIRTTVTAVPARRPAVAATVAVLAAVMRPAAALVLGTVVSAVLAMVVHRRDL